MTKKNGQSEDTDHELERIWCDQIAGRLRLIELEIEKIHEQIAILRKTVDDSRFHFIEREISTIQEQIRAIKQSLEALTEP